MKKNHRLISALLAAAFTVSNALGLPAYANTPPAQDVGMSEEIQMDDEPLCEHTWSETLSHDDAQHYYECTVCAEKKDAADHVFEDASDTECDTCGYKLPDEMLWFFNENLGLLAINHNSVMADYDSFENAPWASVADKVKIILITAGITRIGDNAFAGCENMEQILIAESVKSIGDNAFAQVEAPEVHIAGIESWCGIEFDSYESNPLYYAGDLYVDGTLISELVIPEGVTKISDGAFIGCASIKSIDLAKVAEIGEGAFAYCAGITKLNIPESVSAIGEGAFCACVGIDSIEVDVNNAAYTASGNCLIEKATKTVIAGCANSVIPDDGSVSAIGAGAFACFTELLDVTVSASVTDIGEYAFFGCTALERVVIGEGVLNIGEGAFALCTSLREIAVTNSIENIGAGAFAYCNITLTFSDKAPVIGESAFEGAVATIYYNPTRSGWSSITGGQYGGDLTWIETEPDWSYDAQTGTLYINDDAAMENYASYRDVPWYSYTGKISSVVIKDGVTKIGDYAFYGCKDLENISIPEGVVSIGCCSFFECISLDSIKLPTSLLSIDAAAFEYCTGLESIFIPVSVGTVGEGAFSGCDKLARILYGGSEEQWNALENKPVCENVTFNYVEPAYIPGDMNKDEKISDSDAVYLLMYTFFPEDYPVDQPCDYNGDGKVSDSDAVYLLMYTFFPEDYPLG